jgi:hypothetical protein
MTRDKNSDQNRWLELKIRTMMLDKKKEKYMIRIFL